MTYAFEVAVDSLDSALTAQACGATRIELCADLPCGGLTPSAGLLELVCARLDIPVFVLIRPRRGDFLYSAGEFEVMRRDIAMAQDIGAAGIVSGCLTADGDIDVERTAALLDLARTLPFTFHRAFDVCREPLDALERLASLGVARLLTSGQRADVLAGAPLIAQLRARAARRLEIMPGSGINEGNIAEIARITGCREFHFSARETVRSGMRYRNPSLPSSDALADVELRYASGAHIRAIIGALREM